jgi:hypothetical protein
MFRLMPVFPGASVNRLDHPRGGCWFIMPLCLAAWFFSLSFFHSDVVLLVSRHLCEVSLLDTHVYLRNSVSQVDCAEKNGSHGFYSMQCPLCLNPIEWRALLGTRTKDLRGFSFML